MQATLPDQYNIDLLLDKFMTYCDLPTLSLYMDIDEVVNPTEAVNIFYIIILKTLNTEWMEDIKGEQD